MRYVLTWFVLTVVIAIGIGSLNWPTYRRMAVRGVSGQATVIELGDSLHIRVEFLLLRCRWGTTDRKQD